ncbi:MAG: CHAP domain-containing protein [Bacillota bacterium]|nr:CHAP domain-containing protein [Bacillota bacterium]
MKNNRAKKIRAILAFASALAIGVAFMPVNTESVYAAKFSTDGEVTGFAVTSCSADSVTFGWDSYAGASGYHVFKASGENGKYTKVGRSLKTGWKRTGLTTNKTCYYKVRAFYKNSSGKVKYSRFSSVIAGTPAGFSTKAAPKGFKVAGRSYNSVNMVWEAYTKASGYQIYKATSKNGTYKKIKAVKGTSYNRTGLTTNKTCYYKVRAYYKKSNGKFQYSRFSGAIKGTPQLNTPEISVVGKTDGIRISWPAVAGAAKYQVYRATGKDGDFSKIGTTSSKNYTNTSIKKNKYYYYKVRAYRTVNGKNKYSGYSSVQAGVTAPGQVGTITATSAEDGIALSWPKVSGASGYEIQRATGSGSYSVVGTAATNSFKDVNVANGQTYSYKVRAYAELSGGKSYGAFSKSGYSRAAVVSTAVAWLGCKESNKSNKPIVELYNKNMGTSFSYRTPWCAMFVSAVAIKSGTTDIIVRGSYCPSVINTYKKSKTSNYKYAAGPKYVPKAGDVIFFDWNRNGVPDHTGLVASVSGKTIKTIEGNYRDAVGYRTFSAGYSMVQGYGLPNYDNASGIVFTGQSKSSVGCGELSALGIGTEPEGYEDLGKEYDFVEQKVEDNIGCDGEISDYEKIAYMVKKVRTNAETEGIDCAESQYYAAFIYELCKEADIEASIMTAEDAEGTIHAWVETELDGKWYKVDASKSSDQIESFEHEATDTEG